MGVDGSSEEMKLGGSEGWGLASEEKDIVCGGVLDVGEEGMLGLLGWSIGGHGDH